MTWNTNASCVLSDFLNWFIRNPQKPIPNSLVQSLWDVTLLDHEEITVVVNIALGEDLAVKEILDSVAPAKRKRVEHLCKLLIHRGYDSRRYSEKSLIKKLDETIKNLGG